MAVVVVHAGAGHRDPGPSRGEERRVLPGRTVVRDLQDVRTQVDAGAQEPALGLGLGVTGQQQPYPVDLDPQNQTRVVLDGRFGIGGLQSAGAPGA